MRTLVLMIIGGLLVSGCFVQSLHVFYTADSQVELPELMGDWQAETLTGSSVTNRQITAWTFDEDTVDTYDESNLYSELQVVYFKVDDTVFMDFSAGSLQKGKDTTGNFYWAAGLTAVHSLCKLELSGGRLTLIPLDLKWFEKGLKGGTLKLPYVKSTEENSNYIFTAKPEEWVAFLKTVKDDDAVFNPKYQFEFVREK